MSLDSIIKKPAIMSLGVLGSLFGFASSVVGIAGQVVTDPSIAPIIPHPWVLYVTAAGSLISLIGRVTATKQIGGIFTAK